MITENKCEHVCHMGKDNSPKTLRSHLRQFHKIIFKILISEEEAEVNITN